MLRSLVGSEMCIRDSREEHRKRSRIVSQAEFLARRESVERLSLIHI